MKFEVVRGYVERDGALLTKGASFDAPEDEVENELRKGIIVQVGKSKKAAAPSADQEVNES